MRRKSPKTHRVNIRLGTELLRSLEALAAEERRSLSNMLRQLVLEALEHRDQPRTQVRATQ